MNLQAYSLHFLTDLVETLYVNPHKMPAVLLILVNVSVVKGALYLKT